MSISRTGIHVDESSSFTNPLVYEENGQVNSVVADQLTPLTRYYTRGYVISDGQTVYSGNIKSFVTKNNNYLSFKNVDSINGTFGHYKGSASTTKIFDWEYSYDRINWVTWTADSNGDYTVPVNVGQTVYLRGDNDMAMGSGSNYPPPTGSYRYYFNSDFKCEAGGAIMSIVSRNSDDWNTITSTPNNNWMFANLFANYTNLVEADIFNEIENIDLPSVGTFSGMFVNSGLSVCPQFTALSNADIHQQTFYSMFQNCVNLPSYINPFPVLETVNILDRVNVGFCGMCSGSSVEQIDFSSLIKINYSDAAPIFTYFVYNTNNITDEIWIGVEEWDTTIFNNWTNGVASSGTLHLSQQLRIGTGTGEIPLDSDSGIPRGWTYVQDLP